MLRVMDRQDVQGPGSGLQAQELIHPPENTLNSQIKKPSFYRSQKMVVERM
jgi:hypothetical protein